MGAKEMIEERCMRVLIVEDNKADARLVRALLEETGMPTQITLVGDGEKAIQVMESAAKGNGQAPDLVLLDINLPKKNGHEVLASIRDSASIANTFIAMCSGSSSCEDIRRSRNNGANAYLLKPMGLEEMEEIIARLRNILISLNERPNLVMTV
jgi:Response regulators consisting of a CheY-like receiver domain and a winged-helix DNA-binding domain